MNVIVADNLIIGSGAGGATAFWEFAKAGVDVLMIEEGADWSAAGYEGSIGDLTAGLYRNAGARPIWGAKPIAFGEGRVLGGSTEINGGLFWPTPESVLDEWISRGFVTSEYANALRGTTDAVGRELGMSLQRDVLGFDRDSHALENGARSLGWKVVPVPRVVTNCQRRNQCGSGCPAGAKNSMSRTLIPRGEAAGGRVLSDTRAEAYERRADGYVVKAWTSGGIRELEIRTRRILVAGGAFESVAFLRRSKTPLPRRLPLHVHLNLKLLARFPFDVSAEKGTMFTRQIQEFLPEGILIMGANFRPEYLAMSLGASEYEDFSEIRKDMKHWAMFTVQVRPAVSGTLVGLGRRAIPFQHINAETKERLVNGINYASRALFAGGADQILVPGLPERISSAHEELTWDQVKRCPISSVHAMGTLAKVSMPAGFSQGSVPEIAQDIHPVDASVLPTAVIESPQGTIMGMSSLTARSLLEKMIR